MPDTYNFTTFKHYYLKRGMHFPAGPKPGQEAPDFTLPTTNGGVFRLGDFRNKRPVLFQFGSITCPMTTGSRSALMRLFRDFATQLQFATIYVREAHPGQRYPAHTSNEQKLLHARDWVQQDKIPWTVAVDSVDGRVHRAYDEMPNSVYLVDKTGRVSFRALWSGQELLLRRQIESLLERESAGEDPVVLGERENLVVPMIRGAAEFERAVGRAGPNAVEDFRREAGKFMYGFDRLMSKIEPVINPGNRDLEEVKA